MVWIVSNSTSIWYVDVHGQNEKRWKQKDKLDYDSSSKYRIKNRHNDRLKKYYMKIAKKHGHHVAITHVANKMVRILWSMLTYKQLYNERKKELYETKLKIQK